ncbi:MAG: restriction endonuclease [Synergistaceae bacterium]|nr:restriction endonuclease [Synergistaceae bacterium]MBQ6738356.1 restriction endonuclease [Synergistaceae bacterium]MBR0233081.1 restriction endonuclease [Synergistaceae bacterium]MBR0317337.1 restriction endonuclease [Synergistaceae bacterium]
MNFNFTGDEASDYENLVSQILTRVSELSQAGFEQLITDLLIRMGYEVYKNAKRRLSSSAIQGIIIEDGPGYKPIYIQTRKLERGSIITSWSMQNFGDAVTRKAGRGLLVTNANFSKPAQDYAREKHIILIDGNILARLMIVHNFCVNIKEVVEIKSIDPNAFKDYEI